MRVILIVLGSVLLVLGAISMLTPIPGGFILLGLGTAMLICTSTAFSNWLMRRRERSKWLNGSMSWMETHLGARVSAALSRTRPTKDE